MRRLLLIFLLAPALHAQTVFNCPTFSAGSGTCGASSGNNTVGGNNFKFNGGVGSVNANRLQLAPAGTSHASVNVLYTTKVNVQAFTSTYTFIPSGNIIGFAFINTNNQPGFQGLSFAAGAGCEGGWFQAKNVGVGGIGPNLIFAIGMDGYNNLVPSVFGPGPNGFTYSNTQVFQATQDPCSPNDGDPNFWTSSRLSTSPVPLNNPSNTPNTTTGDTYSVTITYDGTNVTETLFDVTAGGTCTPITSGACYAKTWTAVNIPGIVGSNTAMVGITGSTISATNVAAMLIPSWTYTVNTPSSSPVTSTYTSSGSSGLSSNFATAPTFSPVAGTYSGTQNVTITSSGSSNICYVLSASAITAGSASAPQPDNQGGCATGTLYPGAVTVSSTQRLYAMAGLNYTGLPSDLVTGLFTIGSTPTASAVTCTPTSGTSTTTIPVGCTNPNTGTFGACATFNGTTPTGNGLGTGCNTGTFFAGATPTVSISTTTTTLKIIGIINGGTDSSVNTYGPYTITNQLWSNVLAGSRATDWTSAGVRGGIPSGSWTQCGATLNASAFPTFTAPTAIINAMNACNGTNKYVLLGPGDFFLNGAIYAVGWHNVELRGSGPQSTRLHFSNGSTCNNGNGSCLLGAATTGGNYPGGPGTIVNWTAGYAQNSTTITLSDASQITSLVGQTNPTMIVLDQCDTGFTGSSCSGSAVDNGNYFNCQTGWQSTGVGCSYGGPSGESRPLRGQTEVVEAISCNPSPCSATSTVVTITPGLHHPTWASGQSPQAWFIQSAAFVGFQGFHIIPSSTSVCASGCDGIGFAGTSNFWVTNVIFDSLPDISLFVTQGSTHGTIESNYIYNAGLPAQGMVLDSSGINYFGHNGLIDNNIIHNFLIGFIFNGPSSGNVVAYNYCTNPNQVGGTVFPCMDTHSNGIDYNLYEGNVAPQASVDQSHGTALMNTFYRDFYTGWKTCANGGCGSASNIDTNAYAIAAISNFRYWNIVDSVLGTPSVSTAGYVWCGLSGATTPSTCNQPGSFWFVATNPTGYVYSFGAGNVNSSSPNCSPTCGPIPYDPNVLTTVMRYNNWDAFNGSTQTNASEVPTGISVFPAITPSGTYPPSFYLSSRPSWWAATIAFPAIGSDISGGNVGQCTGTLNQAGQFGGMPAITSAECTGTSKTAAWGNHVNAIPSMNCFINVLGGLLDGTNGLVAFDANTCYTGSGPPPPLSPSSFTGVVMTGVQQ